MKFRDFLLKINKEYEDILSKKPLIKDRNLELELSSVRGKDFYDVVNLLSKDFDKDCQDAFLEIAEGAKKKYINKHAKKEIEKKSNNRYQKFVNQFIVLQANVAAKAYIENTRFTKVLNLTASDFYAYEVYLLAISQDISFKDAFKQLYKE